MKVETAFQLLVQSSTALREFFVFAFLDDCCLSGIARSGQINAMQGVNLNQVHCTSFTGCITKPYLEERVLLSSQLLAHHVHSGAIQLAVPVC
jgi:hypothetical protein